MLFNYDMLHTNPALCQALTSFTPTEFMLLLLEFDLAWSIYEVETCLDHPPRQRAPGGGRKAALPRVEDKLLFILVYYKLYPLQIVQGFWFGMSQGQANAWIQILTPIVRTALKHGRYLPAREAAALAEKIEADGASMGIIDGTERRQQRPSTEPDQTDAYSGKKHCHTRKNVLISLLPGRKVDYLSPTAPGRRHDKPIAEDDALIFPEDFVLGQDSGFQGYAPPGVIIVQPAKKPKGGALTTAEKARNQLIARFRIVIEHVIAGVKRCHIVKDLFRTTLQGFDDTVMEIACGFHNFRTTWRSHPLPSEG